MSSINTNSLRETAFKHRQRAKSSTLLSALVYAFVFGASGFFVNSFDWSEQAMLFAAGALLGRFLGSFTSLELEERANALLLLADLANALDERLPASTTRETRPAPVPEAVIKVEIPAEPNLPVIPSISAPAEVTAALKTGKAKGKPTRLPPKRKPKTEPPAQA